jgi:hypothetical protein
MRLQPIVLIILLTFCYTVSLHAQGTVRLSGSITSKVTGETLSRASVGIIGTKRGTIANADGKYSLVLEKNASVRLRITSLGFEPDTTTISISEDTKRDIQLKPSPAQLEEVVVRSDASREEARRIMHEVIKRKKLWFDRLTNYTCSAYSRWNIRTISGRDTTVRSVAESNADGYWKKDKGLYERITSRRQTANFPAEANQFSLGEIMNFYDNRIDFDEFSLTTPVADDAFDSYDFDLVATGTLNGSPVWKIKLYPGTTSLAFDGEVWIDELDYSLAYLNVTPSSSVKLGPMKDILLEQTFDLFRDTFWMPINLRSQVTFKLDIPLVPQFKLELISLIKDYNINTTIADSFFTGMHHRSLPNADSTSKTAFDEVRPIPLAADEAKAYKVIDSTVAAKKSDSSSSFSLLSIISLFDFPRYNQVEGWRFGIGDNIKLFDSWPLRLSGDVAYGLRDKLWKYDIGIRQGLAWTSHKRPVFIGSLNGEINGEYKDVQDVWLWLNAHYYDDLAQRGNAYSNIETSITSLIYKRDYQEFYHHKGFTIGVDGSPIGALDATLNYTNENIWDADSLHIVNNSSPSLVKHRNASLAVSLGYGLTLGKVALDAKASLTSSSSALGSDYAFTTFGAELKASKRLGGWGVMDITGRYQSALAGLLPRWDLLYFETRDEFFSRFNNLRGMKPFEFMGDRVWSVVLEHNFYDLPTRLLGLHFMDPLNLQWRFHAAIAAADMLRSGTAFAQTTNGKPFSEIGFGVGNIYNIINLEATWRLTHKTGSDFYPTVSIAFSF